ncbi:polysaccharide biosynthesis protein [Flavobacterium okayamense]|uniref:Polysaccharide biosynthesis protein n=2 Tax=Flavobacterium okayamense TaxID=2830782 RepID=A0ABM7S214_9FLAO|nr:polysaccharide biosynthesis protein [Flavobacterium okayamense]
MLYLQNNISTESKTNYNTVIKPDDVLMIVVSSENPEVAEPYNLKSVVLQSNSEEAIQTQRTQTYIVDIEGYIEFPILGKVKIGGLNKQEAIEYLKSLLKDHVKDAVINMRILNFEVTVLGEVNRPGTFEISSERITILEALGKAGDLTIYGKRKNVLLIRDENGVKSTHRLDLTKSDIVNSPYYYLAQNDVVYVEPNKTRINSSAVGPNIAVGISALSLVVTIIALTTR